MPTNTDHVAHSHFQRRHIGPRTSENTEMLKALGLNQLSDLEKNVVPPGLLTENGYDIGKGKSEAELLGEARRLASENKVYKSFIGLGYYGTHTPSVVLRNIVQNPGWYTAYTPYQAEISQGRMEALLNFQTMVCELTGMQISNASLLDEGTAAAEAMALSLALKGRKGERRFFVDERCFPQTIDVLKTRAKPLGIELIIADSREYSFTHPLLGALLQYPCKDGDVCDYSDLANTIHDQGGLVVAAADILGLCLLQPPGEWGADIAIGNTQRFGVPMGFGGPHAAYFATKDAYKRSVPGRFIGVSKDSQGNPALRLALQTREQHIRREKATSNICTSQVLLAVVASMYAVYHGASGLKTIAEDVHRKAGLLANGLKKIGHEVLNERFFDTITVRPNGKSLEDLKKSCEENQMNLNFYESETVSLAVDETTTEEDIHKLLEIFSNGSAPTDLSADSQIANLRRTTPPVQHPIFEQYHSETEMMRYLERLRSKDISLVHSMIPLGSCTMKLNAATEMEPVTWPEFNTIHPFAPQDQYKGYSQMINQLEGWLADLTGFSAVSLQPNAGSQGEYAGLLVIRKYQESKGEEHRNICLIPSSAHGTNPASAVMAGLKVVVVKCDDEGNIDLGDLREKAEANKDNLSSLMITYPSTHGVFEETIKDICKIIHDNGGQVYMDGANMNALVGLCRPAEFGADVAHLNLHKTFCIPHGGGGPGMGPIGVASHLAKHLPTHPLVKCGPEEGTGAISAAPWGSPSILPISWGYIAMMGNEGLKEATQIAILNANYIAHRLKDHFPILYKGQGGWVAHECIIDTRGFKDSHVTVDDIAKRLMDYGFHAPTMSWPVAGTLMIEPTESESKAELDRFCDAMISIRQEIQEIEDGKVEIDNSALRNAPHTMQMATADEWNRPYSREKAVFPLPHLKKSKVWPAVGRVDNAFGDKNFMCSCPPLDEY